MINSSANISPSKIEDLAMNNTAPNIHPPQEEGWSGHLVLEYERLRESTILSRNRHRGPLVVQRPLYPEGKEVCHTCILHPPGGVVGGDRLEINVSLDRGAKALLTTPGATKFYSSGGRLARQEQHLKVASGACLEWFPQDAIFFPGAEAALYTRIDLAPGATFMGWEILCLGLPSNKKTFTEGRMVNSLSLYRDDKILFQDRLRIQGEKDLRGPSGLRGFPVSATFIISDANVALLTGLRAIAPLEPGALVGSTILNGGLLVVRYLGFSTFAAQGLFAEIWTWLRPQIIGKIACAPRIWAT